MKPPKITFIKEYEQLVRRYEACKKSRGSGNNLLPLLSQAIPFFCLVCARLVPHCAVKRIISWCNAQDLVSKYLLGCVTVTMQHVLNTTWNQSAFSSLGTEKDGEKQKFPVLPQTAHTRMDFPEHVWCDRVKIFIVLPPHHAGQKLDKPLSGPWNRLSFLCSLSCRFMEIRMISKQEAERFSADCGEIILRNDCCSKITMFLYRHESSKLAH